VAHLLAADGAPHGTAIAAREQLAGRGTRGREWHSPLGGLWISVICRPRHAASGECFSVRVGLAVAAAVESVADLSGDLQVKWPNDLYLRGKKLGGILCEARWQGDSLGWIVAGIGINVTNAIPPALAELAVALATVAPAVTAEGLAEPVAASVAAQAAAGGPLTAEELAAFAARDFLRDRRVSLPVPGVVQGIDANGALRIAESGGTTTLALAGTVVLE
jgi:BirA family biotin operon repressor/biotin-[acetyl-CoA-carboxylase] ligase